MGNPGPEPAVEEDGHHILVSSAIQANLLKDTFDMMKAHSGTGKQGYNIDAMLFFNIKDNALGAPSPPGIEGPQSWDNHCGLVEDPGGVGNGNGLKRPAFEVFKKETE